MREIITFTQDELVQMLEGGEVSMPMASVVGGQTCVIFKMEEKDERNRYDGDM